MAKRAAGSTVTIASSDLKKMSMEEMAEHGMDIITTLTSSSSSSSSGQQSQTLPVVPEVGHKGIKPRDMKPPPKPSTSREQIHRCRTPQVSPNCMIFGSVEICNCLQSAYSQRKLLQCHLQVLKNLQQE